MRRSSALLLLLVLPLPALAQEATHPLDELTAAEHWALYETLRAHDGVEEDAEFLYAGLNEPSKAEILAWRPGQSFGRQARVHLAQSHMGYEAVVDVANRTVLEFREVTDRQYMRAPMDRDALADLKEHPDMVAAFEARGITDMSKVRCSVGSDAYFDTEEERGRRVGRARCTNRVGRVSGLGVPIENLVAIVDQKSGEVLRIIDDGPTGAAAPSIGEHHPEAVGPARKALPPIILSQPEGPGYELDGHEVSWEGWRFHFRVDQRRGLVLSRVGHQDGSEFRSVLYQGSSRTRTQPSLGITRPTSTWAHIPRTLEVWQAPWSPDWTVRPTPRSSTRGSSSPMVRRGSGSGWPACTNGREPSRHGATRATVAWWRAAPAATWSCA